LLAATADGRSGPLDEYLGMPGEQADRVLRALLANPHPAVAAALAWWTVPEARSGAIQNRLGRLPGAVTVGDIPSQAEADEWAAEHTFGLIERFPTNLDPQTWLVMASALATRVSWTNPFLLAPSAELGDDSPWRASLSLVLRSRKEHGVGLVSSPVGMLAVHVASAEEGVDVCSVIGPPDVPAAELIAAWLSGATERCDLFEVELGDGHAWSLTELGGDTATSGWTTAVLPAWSTSSEFNLMNPSLGFVAAMTLLNADLPERAPLAGAHQAARAEYSRTGFQGAAVTDEIAITATYRLGPRRDLTVRFNRPFAVFATAVHHQGQRGKPQSPWHELPVFSGWITEPSDITPSPADQAASRSAGARRRLGIEP